MATVPGRFDSELSQAHEEAQREKLQREKLQREKDMLLAEAFSLKQQMEVRGSACHRRPRPRDVKGLLFLHGLENNPEPSLQNEEEA